MAALLEEEEAKKTREGKKMRGVRAKIVVDALKAHGLVFEEEEGNKKEEDERAKL